MQNCAVPCLFFRQKPQQMLKIGAETHVLKFFSKMGESPLTFLLRTAHGCAMLKLKTYAFRKGNEDESVY